MFIVKMKRKAAEDNRNISQVTAVTMRNPILGFQFKMNLVSFDQTHWIHIYQSRLQKFQEDKQKKAVQRKNFDWNCSIKRMERGYLGTFKKHGIFVFRLNTQMNGLLC